MNEGFRIPSEWALRPCPGHQVLSPAFLTTEPCSLVVVGRALIGRSGSTPLYQRLRRAARRCGRPTLMRGASEAGARHNRDERSLSSN